MQQRMFGTGELIFDLAYLTLALGFSLFYLLFSTAEYALLFGTMTLVLVLGDAFHLVPRTLSILKRDTNQYRTRLEQGKRITAVGMTIFYVMLWHLGLAAAETGPGALTAVLYLLAAVRIVFCLTPGDGRAGTGNIVKNIPFFLMGALVCGLFFATRTGVFPWMWLAVLLSFAFYIPVVCLSGKHPIVGVLMLPKSCMYLWIISMGVL